MGFINSLKLWVVEKFGKMHTAAYSVLFKTNSIILVILNNERECPDAFIVSHPHTDHYKGAQILVRYFEIDHYYD